MKRSTLILGLGLCTGVFLYGRERAPSARTIARPDITQLVQAADRREAEMQARKAAQAQKPDLPATPTEAVDKTLPNHAAQIARLEQEYRDHPGFRQLVTDYNDETGHPTRGVTASLEALDQNAVAGAPAFALFRAVQPRAEIARALEHHWRDERERRDRDTTAP
ncbi:hypothetical protein [Acidiphilium acidophilum]|jgi:hypothetical protein|uniref:hypothetical protein n=1 Tax=Acidiphilium acidophilum TaxID=76588 RepID=UPI002E8E7477|nr:hypothetical protein [Acidiphilium acidophilum]